MAWYLVKERDNFTFTLKTATQHNTTQHNNKSPLPFRLNYLNTCR